MITLGVTGGMGSGKSEFCQALAELGATVLYADTLAKEMMQNDSDLKAQIVKTFGEESYLESGQLNTLYLAEQAFSKHGVNKLNQLVHPAVKKETLKRITEAKSKGVKLFVKEAALLLLEGRPAEFDHIVLLKANQQERVKRIQGRDQRTLSDILGRMKAQPSEDEMELLSDIIIENEGSLDELRLNANKLYQELIQK